LESGTASAAPLKGVAFRPRGGRELYIASEELGRNTRSEKWRDFKIEHPRLKFCKHIEENLFPNSDAVFIA